MLMSPSSGFSMGNVTFPSCSPETPREWVTGDSGGRVNPLFHGGDSETDSSSLSPSPPPEEEPEDTHGQGRQRLRLKVNETVPPEEEPNKRLSLGPLVATGLSGPLFSSPLLHWGYSEALPSPWVRMQIHLHFPSRGAAREAVLGTSAFHA